MVKKELIRNGPAGGVTSILENPVAYNILENEEEDSAEITMYGEVVTDRPHNFWSDEGNDRLYIVLSEFLKDLEKVKERSKLTVRINSPGGDLYAGLAIMNRLSELKGDVTTVVDGLAASAASIILQAGKTRKVYNGSLVMVHGVSTFLFGSYNEEELKETINKLNACNRAVVDTYAQKLKISKNEIQALMRKTEWMTGQEAIEKGFADELIEPEKNVSMSINRDRTYMVVNGIRMSTAGFETLPAGLEVDEQMAIFGSKPISANKENNEGGLKMTAEELREKYPDLVAKIKEEAEESAKENQKAAVDAAITDERRRISEIDQIANVIGDKDLLKKAKYEEPMSAAQLALEAMQQQAKLGKNFINDSEADTDHSGVNDVDPLPTRDIREEIDKDDIIAGAALIAGIKKGE